MVKFLGGKTYTRKEFEFSHKNLTKLRNWNKVQFTANSNVDSHKSILLTQITLY